MYAWLGECFRAKVTILPYSKNMSMIAETQPPLLSNLLEMLSKTSWELQQNYHTEGDKNWKDKDNEIIQIAMLLYEK